MKGGGGGGRCGARRRVCVERGARGEDDVMKVKEIEEGLLSWLRWS